MNLSSEACELLFEFVDQIYVVVVLSSGAIAEQRGDVRLNLRPIYLRSIQLEVPWNFLPVLVHRGLTMER